MSKSITILSATQDSSGVVSLEFKRHGSVGLCKFSFWPITRIAESLTDFMSRERIREIIFTPRAVKNLDDLLCFARLGGQK